MSAPILKPKSFHALFLVSILTLLSACGQQPSPHIEQGPSEAVIGSHDNPELAGTLKMISAHRPLRVKEVSDPDSKSNRRVLDTLTRRLLLSTARLPASAPPAPPPNSPVVGTLETDFSVDNRGTGEYTVWLKVPESRSSLAPSPSITYYSNSGTSSLGWRFAFSTGFPSSIKRGRSILARDDEARGIEFSASDKYYLGGKRLICISGPDTYGKPGSRYRTEVDSFSRITATGEGDNITAFTLVDQDGRIFTFGQSGTSTDGYQPAYLPEHRELDTLAFVYALKRVEDSMGNWMEFDYEHFGYGEWLLTHIAYTGGPDVDPLYHLRIAYEANDSIVPNYFSLRRSDRRMRMKSIKVNATIDAVPVTQYHLTYDDSSGGGVPHLTSINSELAHDIGALTQALPPVRFHWSEGRRVTDERALSVSAPLPVQTSSSPTIITGTGDFDADGKLDHLVFDGSLSVSISDSKGFGSKTVTWMPSEKIANLLSHPFATEIRIGDVNGDGLDDVILVASNGRLLSLISAGNRFLVHAEIDVRTHLFALEEPALPPAGSKTNPILTRVNLGDMTGDGRDDLVIHGIDGILHCFPSQGTSFSSTPFSVESHSTIRTDQPLRSWTKDMNGDGNADYTWIEPTEASTYQIRCVLALPERNLSQPFDFHEWPAGPTALISGDFNNDDLPDFLVGSTRPSEEGGWQWSLSLNRGMTTQQPLPNLSPVTKFDHVLEIAETWLSPSAPSQSEEPPPLISHLGFGPGIDIDPGLNLMAIDTNSDGRDDVVFHRAFDSDLPRKSSTGWWSCQSKGDGSFTAPQPLERAPWTHLNPAETTGIHRSASRQRSVQVLPNADIDGDGLSDWASTHRSGPGKVSTIAFPTISSGDSDHCDFKHLVTHFTDGLGSTFDVAYKAAKDDSIYTPGAPVEFPLRELRSSIPIVSDVWHDAGGDKLSQFSYFYAGNRIDFSGRGGLGFAIFVTKDQVTGFFKFQQVEHTFPLTGLIVKEASYRTWKDDDRVFVKLLSSEDRTNVFDLVRDPFTGALLGTVHPFNTEKIELVWSADNRASYSLRLDKLGSSAPSDTRIPRRMSIRPSITNTTHYWFDEQNQDQPPTLEYPTTTVPWILSDSVNSFSAPSPANRVDMVGAITYGNQRLSYLDYEDGFFTRKETFYQSPNSPNDPFTSLVSRRSGTEYIDSTGEQSDPEETYHYLAQTSLLSRRVTDSRLVSNSDSPGITETLYERDERGRLLTARQNITPSESTKTPDEEPDNRIYVAADYYDHLDLPYYKFDLEDGNRTMQYNPLHLAASEIDYTNGGRVRVDFDELGRSVRVRNLDSGYLRTTQYEWAKAESNEWPQTQIVPPPPGAEGIVGISAYAVRTEKTDELTVTEYHDRLDRIIRIRTDSPEGESTFTDTIFNTLGSEAAESEAYGPTDMIPWSIHQYDSYGDRTNTLQKDFPRPH